MPRRNRVLPSGDLAALAQRGAWMGNRGLLHDNAGEVVRRQTSYRAWITCLLAFKDRHRAIMAPRRYTELFFMDEATAFAAGHRPCYECRRADYRRFVSAWERAGLGETSAPAMDARLGADRLEDGRQRLARMRAADLPDGTIVTLDAEDSWLVRGDVLRRWTVAGYTDTLPRSGGLVRVRTPRAIVDVLRAGCPVQIDGSAI